MFAEGAAREMRAIWLLVSMCAVVLVAAGCGTSLGPKGEGLELQPGAPLPVTDPLEPEPPLEPIPIEEIDPTVDPEVLLEEDPIEPVEVEAAPVNPFSEAVRLMLRGRSVRIAVTATSVLPESGSDFRVRSDGFFDVRAFVGAIDVDTTNLVRRLGEQGSAAANFLPGRIVFDERTVYLNYELLPTVAPGQQPWAAAKFRQLVGRPQWPDQGTIAGLALTTPAHVAALLTSSRQDFVEIGRQPIRGASSTHYQAVVDLGKLGPAAPEPMRAVVRTQARALADALGTVQLPIDVWLDAKGRLRRVQIDLGAAAAAAAAPEPEAPDETAAGEAPESETPASDPTAEAGAIEEAFDGALPGEPAAGEEPSADGERTLEGEPGPVEPTPPNAVLVIDFVTFSGRVRAQPPAEDETTPYAQVARLARAATPSSAG